MNKEYIYYRNLIDRTPLQKLLNYDIVFETLNDMWYYDFNTKFGHMIEPYYKTLVDDLRPFGLLNEKKSIEFKDLFYDMISHHIEKKYSKDDILPELFLDKK